MISQRAETDDGRVFKDGGNSHTSARCHNLQMEKSRLVIKNTKQTVVKSMIDSKSYDFHIFARQNRKCSQDESSSIQTWNCWL